MEIGAVEQQLKEHGALQTHVDHFWRQWILRKNPTARTPRVPEKAKETFAEMNRMLSGLYSVIEENPSPDGSLRLVLRLFDNQLIETVVLPGNGVCISTQVGCAVGCLFCMTGKSGLIRQLTDLEIVSQVHAARQYRKINKVVFMGMGEPSHNLRRVMNAVNFLAVYGAIGYKNLVVSTVGDKRLFDELRKSKVKPALAISLHTTDDEKRKKLLPGIKPMPVNEIMDFADEYATLGAYPIQFQWTLLKDINDDEKEVDDLIALWKRRRAILNMIPVNFVEGNSFTRPSEERMEEIARKLKENHVLLKYRNSAAQEVDGGCGQLRARKLKELEPEPVPVKNGSISEDPALK